MDTFLPYLVAACIAATLVGFLVLVVLFLRSSSADSAGMTGADGRDAPVVRRGHALAGACFAVAGVLAIVVLITPTRMGSAPDGWRALRERLAGLEQAIPRITDRIGSLAGQVQARVPSFADLHLPWMSRERRMSTEGPRMTSDVAGRELAADAAHGAVAASGGAAESIRASSGPPVTVIPLREIIPLPGAVGGENRPRDRRLPSRMSEPGADITSRVPEPVPPRQPSARTRTSASLPAPSLEATGSKTGTGTEPSSTSSGPVAAPAPASDVAAPATTEPAPPLPPKAVVGSPEPPMVAAPDEPQFQAPRPPEHAAKPGQSERPDDKPKASPADKDAAKQARQDARDAAKNARDAAKAAREDARDAAKEARDVAKAIREDARDQANEARETAKAAREDAREAAKEAPAVAKTAREDARETPREARDAEATAAMPAPRELASKLEKETPDAMPSARADHGGAALSAEEARKPVDEHITRPSAKPSDARGAVTSGAVAIPGPTKDAATELGAGARASERAVPAAPTLGPREATKVPTMAPAPAADAATSSTGAAAAATADRGRRASFLERFTGLDQPERWGWERRSDRVVPQGTVLDAARAGARAGAPGPGEERSGIDGAVQAGRGVSHGAASGGLGRAERQHHGLDSLRPGRSPAAPLTLDRPSITVDRPVFGGLERPGGGGSAAGFTGSGPAAGGLNRPGGGPGGPAAAPIGPAASPAGLGPIDRPGAGISPGRGGADRIEQMERGGQGRGEGNRGRGRGRR